MIGVFDSGIGGLSLLREVLMQLPDEAFCYYADSENVPYSYQKEADIVKFVENAVDYLIRKGAKAIVLACNTATNLSVDRLRANYDLPIIAIQPAIKVAIDHNFEQKRILACATPITLKSDRFRRLVESLDTNNLIDSLPLPKLVEFAEHEIFDERVEDYLAKEFSKFPIHEYKYVVLGCTHFSYFKDNIQKYAPHLVPIDGNFGTARYLKNVLESKDLLNKNTFHRSIEFVESGKISSNPSRFERYLQKLEQ